MSTSLTVIGGHSGAALTGLVTVPSFFSTASGVNPVLQGLFTSETNSVLSGTINFENINIAGGTGTVLGTNASGPGLIELTNSNGFGQTTGGAANVTFNLPTGYNFLVVEAPGTETINSGNVSDFTAVFGGASSVSFIGEGSGSVYAAGAGDNIITYGTAWSVFGSDAGGTSVASGASHSFISVGGGASAPGNVVGIGGANVSSTVVSSGTNDLIEDYSGNAVVSVNGSGTQVLVNGGNDTVYADAGSSSVVAFFNSFGGNLVFINNSTVAAQVSAGDPGSAGHTTVEGGAGGGSYEGGDGGNNSLIGGTGLVTLYGGNGNHNFLSASGNGTGAAANALFAGSGNSTLLATSTTDSNQLAGGGGTDSIVSFGSGQQSFFVGNGGSETLSGSTVAGATNDYYFLQNPSDGGGTDVITDFQPGVDHGYINPFGGDTGVSINGISTLAGTTTLSGGQTVVGGTILSLDGGTTIKLIGVNQSSLSVSIGGTTF